MYQRCSDPFREDRSSGEYVLSMSDVQAHFLSERLVQSDSCGISTEARRDTDTPLYGGSVRAVWLRDPVEFSCRVL